MTAPAYRGSNFGVVGCTIPLRGIAGGPTAPGAPAYLPPIMVAGAGF